MPTTTAHAAATAPALTNQDILDWLETRLTDSMRPPVFSERDVRILFNAAADLSEPMADVVYFILHQMRPLLAEYEIEPFRLAFSRVGDMLRQYRTDPGFFRV